MLTDDLQIHLVELAKSRAADHNLGTVSALERWAYFLRNAAALNAESVRALFPEPEFVEAAGVLEMIARTPEQRMLYNARLKFQRDEAARMEYAVATAVATAQAEGEQIGQVRGEQIGQVRLLQKLLGLPQTDAETLSRWSSAEFTSTIDDLQRQLRERISPA